MIHAGFMAMEPGTGQIKAWVGGINHRFFKYDNVRPSSKRQVGSTFKPFIYSLAVQNGWSPCQKAPNMPVTFDKYDMYTPENASDFKDGEMMTLKEGLALSVNRITAYLMKQLNPQQMEAGYVDMVEFFQRMGIQSDILPVPAMCLGVADLSVYEMVGAYGTFANKGVWVEPTFITRIEDKSGNIIQEFTPAQVEALDQYSSYAMIELLRNVVNIGTGRRLRTYKEFSFTSDIIGKTGTTQDNSDGWFMGSVPNLVAGTWIGGDDKFITIKNTGYWSGASLGIPVFGKFMNRVYEDGTLGISKEDIFERPEGLNIMVDCERYDTPQIDPFTGQPVSSAPVNNGYNTPTESSTGNQNTGTTTSPGDGSNIQFRPGATTTPSESIRTDEEYGDEFD